jgi:hypothetical protein
MPTIDPLPAKRSAPRMAEALEFQGGPTPSRSIMDRITMPDEHDCGCTEKGTDAGRCVLRGWPAQRHVEAGHALQAKSMRAIARKVSSALP